MLLRMHRLTSLGSRRNLKSHMQAEVKEEEGRESK